MKLKFNDLNKNEYKRTLKYFASIIIKHGSSFNSEFLIGLFIQSFDLTQFVNLHCLSFILSTRIVIFNHSKYVISSYSQSKSFLFTKRNSL